MAKQLSAHAACAKSIRAGLKKLNIKPVSVTSQSYAGGNSVYVTVEDLNPVQYKLANDLVASHQMGSTRIDDSYDYSNRNDKIAQVKFAFLRLSFSDAMYEKAFSLLTPENTIGLDLGEIPSTYAETCDNYKLRELIDRILRGKDSCNFFSKELYTNEQLGLLDKVA